MRAWTSAVRPSMGARISSRARSSRSGPGGCGRALRGSSPAETSSGRATAAHRAPGRIRQVVVHRGGAQATRQVVPPAEHVPGHHRGEPIVAVGSGEVLDAALQVEHYPGGDLTPSEPPPGPVPVAGGPRRSRVSNRRTLQEGLLNRCPSDATRRWSGARWSRRRPPCSRCRSRRAARRASRRASRRAWARP